MATVAQSVLKSPSYTGWFWEFIKEELAPYPGRAELVARMVVTSTIVMILSMTFQLPYAAYGSVYALSLSRENPRATVNAAKIVVVAYACSVLYVITGAIFFLEYPDLRLLWVMGTLFVMFLALSILSNYAAAARFGYLLIITIPLWDEHIPARLRLENTLWAFGTITFASIITALVEVVYAQLKPQDGLVESVARRLEVVERLLREYLNSGSLDAPTKKEITRLAMVGTSRLRRDLHRSSYAPQYMEQMSAVVVLVGRLVDLAANLANLGVSIPADDRERIRTLVQNVATLRQSLLAEKAPGVNVADAPVSPTLPLLGEMEKTMALIGEVFTGSQPLSAYAPPLVAEHEPRTRFFVRDAFTNPDHLKFALRGCLAASLCYLIYNGKDWPGISTCITTCFLTALSTVGSSRQKQALRFAGAAVGALLALGAQIFILPNLDSIAGFTVLFIALTVPAAWIATSSSRLSYFGLQIAVAIYLINLADFSVQTSLYPARDRVIGIFLGLLMMWLVFDRFGAVSAVTAMKKAFVEVLRGLAQFTREPVSSEFAEAAERSLSVREKINQDFASVRALADGVMLEFGPSRDRDIAWRENIVEWQPQLRILFLTRIALWKYRARLPGFELPETVRAAQHRFDEELAKKLDAMADWIEGKAPTQTQAVVNLLEPLERAIREARSEDASAVHFAPLENFLRLCRTIGNLTNSLEQETRDAQMQPPHGTASQAHA